VTSDGSRRTPFALHVTSKSYSTKAKRAETRSKKDLQSNAHTVTLARASSVVISVSLVFTYLILPLFTVRRFVFYCRLP
jgi:integral membrane sensor domain MASE1